MTRTSPVHNFFFRNKHGRKHFQHFKMVDLVDKLSVMFRQEESSYKTQDYLDPTFQNKLALLCESDYIEYYEQPSTAVSLTTPDSPEINDIWREKICEWSYQVVDHFDFSREVVNVSIHYLDRYLATRPVNKKVFQLAAMTTLFLAIKLLEPGRLSMMTMIELSRGYFTVQQMSDMESSILRSLCWHVNPPTAHSFSYHLLFLLSYKTISIETRHHIHELARFLTELSVIDYFFVIHRPSVVAYSALLNAMEDIPGGKVAIPELGEQTKLFTHLRFDSPSVGECRERLRLLFDQGSSTRPNSMFPCSREETTSPTCVSGAGQKCYHVTD